jgi:hypothetical protein
MSNRDLVIDLVSKLPADVALEDVLRRIELLAGIQTACKPTPKKRGVPAQVVRELADGLINRELRDKLMRELDDPETW